VLNACRSGDFNKAAVRYRVVDVIKMDRCDDYFHHKRHLIGANNACIFTDGVCQL
jgi:hypothetical protein